jgi:predicted transcriptional regulator of viral defense system
MSPPAFQSGVEVSMIEGVEIKVFSVAKTLADCFKFRSLVGTDVCVEALGEAIRRRKVSPAELYQVAMVARVWEIIRPYLDVISCQLI